MSNPNEVKKANLIIEKKGVHKIQKYEEKEYYIVTGETGEYLVILPNFCSCDHFTFRCINVPGKVCKHIIAANNYNNPDTILVDPKEYLK
ncbi:MAG: SWIM zinc finger family protein [Candidatus Heimdallarchaeota archaeon]|nr:SWIM zinc finger family protein [Candidatus Heimdallarchaeota archaeon]